MTYTVEKIGGTSMTEFDAVLDNIILRPATPYNRVFVVSAYGGITDMLLECKRSGQPGIYQYVARRDDEWKKVMEVLLHRLLLINDNMFADPITRLRADKFIRSRIGEAENCINNIMETCQYGQFSLRHYLPQIREFLSSIGEAHSAYNTVLKLKTLGVNARFVDLSGWSDSASGSLDQVIQMAFENINVQEELPIVTGYAYCDEGLMKTYDRGYSEMTFSRVACLTKADKAIIHKEYHLSTADPRIVGADRVNPMGTTNFDVADQLANLGMEAIHPNAASGLRQNNIELCIKNTFEPDHRGTLISQKFQPERDKVEIIAGRGKVFALHVFDQAMVGNVDNVGYDIMEVITGAHVDLIGKEMNANSITYYLKGRSENLSEVQYKVEKRYPLASVNGRMVALVSVIGASLNTNAVLSKGMLTLMDSDISPIAAHSSMRNVNVQFVIEDEQYHQAIQALHSAFIDSRISSHKPQQLKMVN